MATQYRYYKSRWNVDKRGKALNCQFCDDQIAISNSISFKPNPNSWKYTYLCLDASCIASCISEYNCEESLKSFINREFNSSKANPRTVDKDGFCQFPLDANFQQVKAIVKGLGARFLSVHSSGNKGWQLPTDMLQRANIVEILTSANFEIDSSFSACDNIAAAKAQIDRHIEWAQGKGLYSFQVVGLSFLLNNNRALLGDDMGLGKTVQSLCALPMDGTGSVVIVVPASLKLNWLKECQVWRSDYTPVVVMGSSAKKKNTEHIGRFRMPKQGEIVIVNYEQLPAYLKLKPTSDKMELIKELTIIVDECHLTKSSKAQRTIRTRNLTWYAKQSWGLSGTPLLNRAIDLWGVLTTFSLQTKVFGSFDNFIELMGGDRNGYGGRIQWHFGEVDPSVPGLMQRAMLRRTKQMALPGLPSKLRNTVYIDMDADLKSITDNLWGRYAKSASKVTSVHDRRDELLEIARDRQGDRISDHDQDQGEYYGNSDSDNGTDIGTIARLRKELASRKISVANEIIADFEDAGKPLVVFSAHVDPCNIIGSRPGWASITGSTPNEQRQEIVEQFQKGLLKGVVGTIKAMGVGLTLLTDVGVEDCDSMLFIDLEWNPSLNQQAEDRICRIHKGGKVRDRVTYITLAFNHPIDEHVLELVADKQLTIDQSIELASDTIYSRKDTELERLREIARQSVPVVSQSVDLSELDDILGELSKAKTERELAKVKAKAIGKYEGYRGKWLGKSETKAVIEQYPAIPVAIKHKITGAIRYLRSVCDGAVSDDGMGFNRPDAATMHLMDLAGIWYSDEYAFHIAWGRLWKYRGQLESDFPELHDPKIAKVLNKSCKR